MPVNLISAGGGTTTLTTASSASNFTLTLPASTGTVATTATAGKVLQVVSVVKDDVATLSSTSFTDISGLSASITPTSATSKILIQVAITYGGSSNAYSSARLVRDSTAIALGSASGSRIRASFTTGSTDVGRPRFSGITFLDSPATTSSTTYKVQLVVNSGQSVKINTSNEDEDNTTTGIRTVSTITVMEIAA
jgi:hypothetical protein